VADHGAVYHPLEYYQKDPFLRKTIDMIRQGFFNPEAPSLFQPLMDSLLNHDPFMVLADFEAYHQCQMKVDALFRHPDEWTGQSILNVARMGKFSSDRTVWEYNRDIWHAEPLTITKGEKTVSGNA